MQTCLLNPADFATGAGGAQNVSNSASALHALRSGREFDVASAALRLRKTHSLAQNAHCRSLDPSGHTKGAAFVFDPHYIKSLMDNRNIIDNFLKDWKIDSPQNFIYALNVCGCYSDCWAMTGISGNCIRRFLSKYSRRKAYKSFKIPKKSGGFRTISAPVNDLKDIQRAINAMLLSIFEPSPYAMGFCRNRGVDTNAKIHIGQTCIFNTDLENFFPSITKQMVRKARS